MNAPQDSSHSAAEAARWVSQITAIAVEIVVFIWLGNYLDGRFGTSFCSLIGLFVGPLLGFWHLMVLVGIVGKKNIPPTEKKDDGSPR